MKRLFIALGQFETINLTLWLFLIYYPDFSIQQTRSEPVNVGLIAALPWDISNTLRAPIGGPVAVILTAITAAALLLGFLLAPVHYFLGYPSRIYHPARKPGLISEYLYIDKTARSLTGGSDKALLSLSSNISSVLSSFPDMIETSRTFKDGTENLLTVENGESLQGSQFPDFISSAFMFLPEKDIECRKLILCHSHGFIQSLPERFTKFIRFFSKRAKSVPDEYKEAVILGLKCQDECIKTYKCQKDISTILKDILYDLISTDLKHIWNLRKLF